MGVAWRTVATESIYRSCNCKQCKRTTSARKRFHKRTAHRKLRRMTKLVLRFGGEFPPYISTGYKA